MVVEPKDGGAAIRLVAADPLEDACSVVEPVRADVDAGIRPVHVLAVHPDLVRLLHRRMILQRGVLGHVGGLCSREPNELGRRDDGEVPLGSRTDPHDVVTEQLRIDQDSLDAGKRERRHRAGVETGDSTDAIGPGDPSFRATRRRRNFAGVCTPVARHERQDAPAVAVEEKRLHDLPKGAPDSVGGVFGGRRSLGELLDPRFGPGGLQKRRNELHRRWPRRS